MQFCAWIAAFHHGPKAWILMTAMQGTHRDERLWMLSEFLILRPSNGFT